MFADKKAGRIQNWNIPGASASGNDVRMIAAVGAVAGIKVAWEYVALQKQDRQQTWEYIL